MINSGKAKNLSLYKVVHLTLDHEMSADIRVGHPTALADIRHHKIIIVLILSLLTSTLRLSVATLTVRAVNDGSRDMREVGGSVSCHIGTCVAALTV